MKRLVFTLLAAAIVVLATDTAKAQWTPEKPGSENMKVLGHVPLGPELSVADMDIEQELSRPYAYIARMQYRDAGPRGTDIIDISNPSDPRVIYRWRIENQDLHTGTGGMDVKHFKWKGHYYLVQSLQFREGPDYDVGAVILDVNGLPDATTVHEVARLREPDMPGGFHNIFIYKHTNGRVLLVTTIRGSGANVYDLGRVVEGDATNAFVGNIPNPGNDGKGSYHDFYLGFDTDSGQDRFYGGGTGGYYVYNITDLDKPELLVTLTGISGVRRGHTFTPTPDGRYVIAETEYKYAPLRIFDLKPALDGEVTNISQPIGAWTADWENLAHNHEVRWPFVFVSGYHDGLQVFNMMDPTNPVTVGYYDTYTGSTSNGAMGGGVGNGAFGVDVRNADGLIVLSDMSTGIWTFHMEGFDGWNGEDWGVPNVSSAQKWDEESKEGTQ